MIFPLKDSYLVQVKGTVQTGFSSYENALLLQKISLPYGDMPKIGQETSLGLITKIIKHIGAESE